MTQDDSQLSADPSTAPFGTQPRRSVVPLFFWGALYVVWLGALIWMAAFES